ncbi:ABC transporter substrate-binding protein [Xylanimonas ulmi]|uniref:Raffinose/stachyose/melibiose transport system substrate-binding protein n=1 Tax=Xylanimonas ulmi TaxID=228973 RepID=A0A4V2EY70_9MICO|nr:ABC transporter substrate-binding protein [Xylanibacterium ulmi]RZS61960.1 raffinose/stachyose/melibiose transport system substrate-binding protein [Xylanibacterium ulmi]
MSPSKNLRIGVAMAAAAGLALAGCGSSDDAGDSATGDGDIELTFHSWLPTQAQWPELIAAFEEENPGITITFTREEDYAAFKTNLDNEILAGETPDLFGIQVGSSFDDYADYAQSVDDYASDWIDSVNATALEQTTTSDGTLAAVPVLLAGMEYYLYNKTLMNELGLTLPATYDELVAVSQAAREAGYSPFAMGAADTWHAADFFVWMSNQFGDGGDVYKAAKGEIPWDSDSLVEAATAWQKLFTDGVFQDAATTVTTYPQARDDFFLARKAIAFPTGSWHVGMALDGPDQEQPGTAAEADEIGMALFPTIGANDAGATSGVDFAIAISSDSSSQKQAAAAKFVEFMAVGTGQQLWVNTLQGFPVADGVSIEIADNEPQLGKDSVALVTDTLAASAYARKLASDNASLENDLGIVLQNIAAGADPASELATLN